MDSSCHTRNSGSISGKTEVTVKHWNRVPRGVVASPSLERCKTGWARLWAACCHRICSKQEAGLETLKIPVHPQGFYSSKSFSLTVLEGRKWDVCMSLMYNASTNPNASTSDSISCSQSHPSYFHCQ